MISFIIEVGIILVLTLLNGIFAMSELAIVSSSRGRLDRMAAQGNRGAKAAAALAENPSQFLATVQIGITLVGIIAGVFGGATLAADLGAVFEGLGMPDRVAYPLAFALIVGAITYLSLIFGELVPKQVALSNPERFASTVAQPLTVLSKLCRPLVWILEGSSRSLLRLLPISGHERSEVSEDDIQHMIAEGAKIGEIEPVEKEMAFRIFRLNDRPIRAFMTVRRDVVWLDATKPFDELWEVALSAPHSYFPVADGSLDQMLGVVSVRDLWLVKASGGRISLLEMVRPTLKVPASRDALGVLELFKQERKHMAVIVDEHGGIDGVVTTHDLLEAIVGDLADYEGEQHSIVKRPDGSALVDAAVDLQELFLFFGKEPTEEVATAEYHSVGGLVFRELQGLPVVGAQIKWGGFAFEVVDMDGYRIDKLLVSSLAEAKQAVGLGS